MTASSYPYWIYDGSEIPDPLGHGERAVQFLRRLKHPKSTLPGKAFQLDFWFERVVRRIYGPRNPDGTRIVKTVILLVPRGNRKTSYGSALGCVQLFGPERVPFSEGVFAAADREQAGIAHREIVGIIEADARLPSHFQIYNAFGAPKKIVYLKDNVSLQTISSDAGAQHGRTPSFVLADELHQWKGNLLWEALKTGADKIDNPLFVVATTAGRGQNSVAWEVIEDARKVARGEVDDPSILPILFEAGKDDDWQDEAVWHRVNPGLKHGYPSLEGFQRHARHAERSASERASFKLLKLNMWADQSTSPLFDMDVYDECGAPFDSEVLKDKPCWIGVDMSTTTDLTAVVACVRDRNEVEDRDDYYLIPQFFLPADNLRARGDRDGVPYVQWAEEGYLTATPGNVIDYRAVEGHIRALCERFDVREIGFDPAYAQPVMGPLSDDGLPVTIIRQGWVTQSPALNELERVVIGGNLHHGGNPLLRWCFSNVAIHTDSAGNRTMHKGKSTGRIDGAVASWMAVSRAVAGEAYTTGYADPEFDVNTWIC